MLRARVTFEIFDDRDNLIHTERTDITNIEPVYESEVAEIYEAHFKYMQAKNPIYFSNKKEEKSSVPKEKHTCGTCRYETVPAFENPCCGCEYGNGRIDYWTPKMEGNDETLAQGSDKLSSAAAADSSVEGTMSDSRTSGKGPHT